MKDPYSVLGVAPTATEQEIKSAYKKLAKRYHPDVTGNSPEAAEKMQEINAAYDEIMNRKTSYDPFKNASGYDDSSEDIEYKAAYNYIRYHRFREALNALSGIQNKTGKYYYYSAVAYAGLNDMVNARANAEAAVKLEPGNFEYQNLLNSLRSGRAAYQSRQYDYTPATGFGTFCLSLIMARLCCCFCL
jgi:DnaJ-class molecular chaperone with C-terminal Zn finger domain